MKTQMAFVVICLAILSGCGDGDSTFRAPTPPSPTPPAPLPTVRTGELHFFACDQSSPFRWRIEPGDALGVEWTVKFENFADGSFVQGGETFVRDVLWSEYIVTPEANQSVGYADLYDDTGQLCNRISFSVGLDPLANDPFRSESQFEQERSHVDRQDDYSGPQIHVVYAIASDGEDREMDTNGTVGEMLANMQAFLGERTGQQFRMDTHAGEPDISFVRLGATENDLLLHREGQDPVVDVERLGRLLDELVERDSEKIYAVFYTFDWGENYVTGSAGHAVNVAGTYISHISLGRFGNPRRQRIFETTMIHEVFHLLGAVPNCAPNQGRGNHAIDHDLDVMSNSGRPQWEWTHIDWGNDDYFGHGREDCVDIALSPYFEPA